MAIVVPADAVAYASGVVAKAIRSTSSLSGFEHGNRLRPGVTPRRYIRYDQVGGSDEHRVGDRVDVRFQVWLDGPEAERNRCARILLAHLQAAGGRKTAGLVSLPDPADPMKSLTQFVISVLLIGDQQ